MAHLDVAAPRLHPVAGVAIEERLGHLGGVDPGGDLDPVLAVLVAAQAEHGVAVAGDPDPDRAAVHPVARSDRVAGGLRLDSDLEVHHLQAAHRAGAGDQIDPGRDLRKDRDALQPDRAASIDLHPVWIADAGKLAGGNHDGHRAIELDALAPGVPVGQADRLAKRQAGSQVGRLGALAGVTLVQLGGDDVPDVADVARGREASVGRDRSRVG